jgi:thymidylate kinase
MTTPGGVFESAFDRRYVEGEKGRFMVLYGSNNLGKSTQLNLLEEEWKKIGRPYTRIKYPRYDSPTGKIINLVLRGDENGVKLEMSDEELQCLFAEDRRQYETELKRLLTLGDVFAEDYKGTGIAWGLTKGVDRALLDEYNAGLLEPDIAILLDGRQRFTSGIESGHRHEGAGDGVWGENRRIHQELAAEFGWEVVNANESVETIHENIMEIISRKW